ncbi:MAG: FG-GAP repeat domain-containing protein [Phycisphaerales bacterium JB040]
MTPRTLSTRAATTALLLALATPTQARADEPIDRPTPPALRFGEGAFPLTEPHTPVPSIVAADFNNDSHIDLAWFSGHSPSDEPDWGQRITIAHGLGDGRFVERYVLDQPGSELVAADFDLDGFVDLAVASGELVIRYNLGGQGWSQPTPTGVPCADRAEYGLALTPLDADGDGDTDLLITDAEGRLDTVLNNHPVFTAVEGTRELFASGRPRVADLNNDTIPDLLYRRPPDTLVLRHGLGDGAFAPGVDLAGGVTFFELAPDPADPTRRLVAIAQHEGPATYVRRTDPVAGLEPDPIAVYLGLDEAGTPRLLDLDADGHLDLLRGTDGVLRAIDIPGGGRRLASRAPLTPLDPQADFESGFGPTELLIDVDHDGAPDLVRPGYVRLSRRDDRLLPTHDNPVLTPSLDVFSNTAAADLDDDGFTDTVSVGFNEIEIRYGRSTGPAGVDAPLGAPVSLPQSLMRFSGFIALTADLNADQRPDIVVLDRAPRVLVYRNLGGRAFAQPQIIELAFPSPDLDTRVAGIAASDLDHDGDTDLVVLADEGDRLVTLRNDAGVLVTSASLPLPASDYTTLALLDLDADGHVDAVIGDAANERLLIARGHAGATFSLLGPVYLPAPPYWLAATDANSDGLDDLLVTTRPTDEQSTAPSPILVWHALPAGGISLVPIEIPTDFPALEAFAADIDRDGHNDLVTAQATLEKGAIVVYNGDPTTEGFPDLPRFATTLARIDQPFPAGVVATDLNRDGEPDLVWCSNSTRLDFALQFPATLGPCRTDIQGDTISDTADITAFVTLFLQQHPGADMNRDTVLDAADISEFVQRFLAGC